MRRLLQILSIPFLLVASTSCDRGELPIPAHDPGNVITIQVEMGADYRDQIFFDLGSQSIVASNLKDIWDLGFESSLDGWHVVLNSARGGAVWRTGQTDWNAITDTLGASWKYDAPTGNLDSTAFGDYRGGEEVLVLDRGYNHEGVHTGFRKIRIKGVSAAEYEVMSAELDGAEETEFIVPKDENLNFVSVSLDQNTVVEIEPDKEDWDLLFTQYTYIFDDPPLAYLVTGVLSNRNKVGIAVNLEKPFEELSFEDAEDADFKQTIDRIGYNWKEYDFGTGSYQVFSNINYLIRDTEGRYFKLHFVDFYTLDGDKGAPKMELQEL